MSRSEELSHNAAYRVALWGISGITIGVVSIVVGAIVKVATGSAILLVISMVIIGVCVFSIWTALFMMIRWARERQRIEGITIYDALKRAQRQMDADVHRLLRRT